MRIYARLCEGREDKNTLLIAGMNISYLEVLRKRTERIVSIDDIYRDEQQKS